MTPYSSEKRMTLNPLDFCQGGYCNLTTRKSPGNHCAKVRN